jgi:hypothetical protein
MPIRIPVSPLSKASWAFRRYFLLEASTGLCAAGREWKG